MHPFHILLGRLRAQVAWSGWLGCLLAAATLEAEVVRFEITSRSAYADGQSFADVGPYEQIEGRVIYAIDPALPQNRAIIDLDLAPRNAEGKVEFGSDLFILAPLELENGNRALLYDVNNRGNKLALRFFNDAAGGNDARDAGHGFLMRQGFTIVWSGWDGELLPGDGRLQLHAPVARRTDSTIVGLVRYEIVAKEDGVQRMNVNRAHHGAYRPTDNGLAQATLTWRLRPGDERVPIPRDQFQLHVSQVDSKMPGQLPKVELEIPSGFHPGYLYELIYEARDPLVHGVCFASLRDLVSALKFGHGGNHPLQLEGQPQIERAYGFGVSQSGRMLREFLYSGFNADEQGRQVFDGLMPHVAGGGLGSFNHRFAQPTAYVTQREHHDWPTDRFPFAYEIQDDPHTGRREGILQRAQEDGVTPLVMHTQSSTEYWSRSGSLVHTDPLGSRDAKLPETVRVYAFGGTQHGPGSYPPQRGDGQNPANPADYRPLLRALLVALDQWCREGLAPPASRYPTFAQQTIADWSQTATGFPAIPGVRYPETIQQPHVLDLGSRWQEQGIVDRQPPRSLAAYKVLVPRCDADGNEVGCLLPPEVAVPLATFTGWNLRRRQAGAENQLVGLNGSYLPLPVSRQDRQKMGDPRASLEQRYQDLPGYLEQLALKCQEMTRDRLLLEEDAQRVQERQQTRAKPLFDKLK